MTNRQLAAMETKKKLLEAAKNIICEKGLINTSIEEITKACGVMRKRRRMTVPLWNGWYFT